MIGSVKISNDDFGEMEVISHRCKKNLSNVRLKIFQKQFDTPDECKPSGDKNGTWWCKIITNEDNCE